MPMLNVNSQSEDPVVAVGPTKSTAADMITEYEKLLQAPSRKKHHHSRCSVGLLQSPVPVVVETDNDFSYSVLMIAGLSPEYSLCSLSVTIMLTAASLLRFSFAGVRAVTLCITMALLVSSASNHD